MVSQNNNTQFGAHATAGSSTLSPEFPNSSNSIKALRMAFEASNENSRRSGNTKKSKPPRFSPELLQNAGYDSPGVAAQVRADREAAAQAEQQALLEHRARIKADDTAQVEVYRNAEAKTAARVVELQHIFLSTLSQEPRNRKMDAIAAQAKVHQGSNRTTEGTGYTIFWQKMNLMAIRENRSTTSSKRWRQETKAKIDKRRRGGGKFGAGVVKTSGHEQRTQIDQFFMNEERNNAGE